LGKVSKILSKYLHSETHLHDLTRKQRVQKITHWKLLFRAPRRNLWPILPSPLFMSEKIHFFHLLNVGNDTEKIVLGHKNYSLTNLYHFFIWAPKFRFLSHCGIWGLHTIVYKHQGPLGYDKSTWHHTQNTAIFSVITQNKLYYKIKDNMTISYHSRFLLNSTLLFPEYLFYSIQHNTSILLIYGCK